MDYETIILQSEEGAATVTLNRPEKLNAMNKKLADELEAAILTLHTEDQKEGLKAFFEKREPKFKGE